VTAVVVGIHAETGAVHSCCEVVVATGVLAKAVGYLNHTACVCGGPFIESDFNAVRV
jgi:hypothetical protein